MKLVFTRAEVAAALGLNEEAFERILPILYVEGFPRPIPGLGDCWSIMDVMTWVNRDKSALKRPPAQHNPQPDYARH